MLDIKFIRQNPELVKEAAQKKGVKVDIDQLLAVNERRRHVLQELEQKRSEQNKGSAGGPKSPVELEKLKKLKEEIKILEDGMGHIEKEFEEIMLQVPQVPDVSVPEGRSDADNKEIKTWGKIPKFDFKAKDYVELMADLGLIDTGR